MNFTAKHLSTMLSSIQSILFYKGSVLKNTLRIHKQAKKEFGMSYSKQFKLLILLCLFVLSLTGCGGGNSGTDNSKETEKKPQ
jgi:hypothetical protein